MHACTRAGAHAHAYVCVCPGLLRPLHCYIIDSKGFFCNISRSEVLQTAVFDRCVTLPGQRNRPVQNLVQRGTETGLDKQVGVTRSLGGEPDLRHTAARAPQRGIMSGDPVGVGAVDSWSWHWW